MASTIERAVTAAAAADEMGVPIARSGEAKVCRVRGHV
jgi:hypothetical protein